MRNFTTAVAAVLLVAAGSYALAQNVDPEIRGPARRAAGAAADAIGAPGLENRIEQRQERRGVERNPDAWRMRFYNDEWWYYTPQNSWTYYRDNRWTPFDRATYRPLAPRYTTGYRGGRRMEPFVRGDRFAYGKPGAPGLNVAIHKDSFEPKTLNVAPGTTISWINRDNADHTVTSADGSWDSGEIAPDGVYSARFKKPGTYHYTCDMHPGMEGTIVVAESSGAAANNRGVDVNVQPGGRVDVDTNRPAASGVNVEAGPNGVEVDRTPAPEPAPQPSPQPQPLPQQ